MTAGNGITTGAPAGTGATASTGPRAPPRPRPGRPASDAGREPRGYRAAVRLIWPLPDTDGPAGVPAELDDAALLARYAPDDRSQPLLRVNFVTSLDGAVAVDGYSEGLSGQADKRVFGLLRMLCDALLVGAGTLRQEGYGALDLGERRRASRRDLGLATNPPLVILSRRLDLHPEHPMFTRAPVRPIVITHAAAPAGRRTALARVADVIVAGDTSVDLPAALAALHERGLRQVLCEGGPYVLGSLIAADLVDEYCLTVSPLLAGGEPGRLSAGTGALVPRRLALRHVLADGDVLLLRYARP